MPTNKTAKLMKPLTTKNPGAEAPGYENESVIRRTTYWSLCGEDVRELNVQVGFVPTTAMA